MLTNNAAGGLGHIQFGELDLGNVPPHIRDAPSPNLPPTVFPMNGYREHRGGEHPREQTLTNGPKENSRSQYMASKADVSSSACGRNELQTQVQVQGGHQSQSQSQRLVGPSSHAFKNTSKGNVQGGFQGSTGKVNTRIAQKMSLLEPCNQVKNICAAAGVGCDMKVAVHQNLRKNSRRCLMFEAAVKIVCIMCDKSCTTWVFIGMGALPGGGCSS